MNFTRQIISLIVMFCFVCSATQSFGYGLGDIPLDPEEYQQYLKVLPVKKALPSHYDARDEGLVTPPKNQGVCGSCWAFACVGGFESHLLKETTIGVTDLSEQQQVSCNTAMSGCCGGNMTALQYWQTIGPFYEACAPYQEMTTYCGDPEQPCSEIEHCSELACRVTNFHTVNTVDPTQVKTSVYDDGPSYFRYDVYSDFYDYWNGSVVWPNNVYRQDYGSRKGGHAVLIIGWDDSLNAYICKNSWGATGGPFGDGTFLMAITAHDNNLNFGMANFNLSCAPLGPCIDIGLSPAGCVNVGETLYATATLTNGPTPTNVDVKVWVKLPTGKLKSIYNIPNWFVPANINKVVKLLEHYFTGSEPTGNYEFGGRFLNPITGDEICGDIETVTFPCD
ncbi:MAG: C1 family peptidase [bacterium]